MPFSFRPYVYSIHDNWAAQCYCWVKLWNRRMRRSRNQKYGAFFVRGGAPRGRAGTEGSAPCTTGAIVRDEYCSRSWLDFFLHRIIFFFLCGENARHACPYRGSFFKNSDKIIEGKEDWWHARMLKLRWLTFPVMHVLFLFGDRESGSGLFLGREVATQCKTQSSFYMQQCFIAFMTAAISLPKCLKFILLTRLFLLLSFHLWEQT